MEDRPYNFKLIWFDPLTQKQSELCFLWKSKLKTEEKSFIFPFLASPERWFKMRKTRLQPSKLSKYTDIWERRWNTLPHKIWLPMDQKCIKSPHTRQDIMAAAMAERRDRFVYAQQLTAHRKWRYSLESILCRYHMGYSYTHNFWDKLHKSKVHPMNSAAYASCTFVCEQFIASICIFFLINFVIKIICSWEYVVFANSSRAVANHWWTWDYTTGKCRCIWPQG